MKEYKKLADSKRNINDTYNMPLFISKTVAAAFFRRLRHPLPSFLGAPEQWGVIDCACPLTESFGVQS